MIHACLTQSRWRKVTQRVSKEKELKGKAVRPVNLLELLSTSHVHTFSFVCQKELPPKKDKSTKSTCILPRSVFFFYINLLMKISRFSRYFTGLFPCCLVNIFYTEILFAFFLSQFRRPTKASHNELYSDSDSFE